MIEHYRDIASAPENVVVQTIISDENGPRNEQNLRRRGRLWWTPDGGMYVYYTPTHWKPIQADAVTATVIEGVK